MGERVAADILEHHGIKGQKWGVRRKERNDGKVSDTNVGGKRPKIFLKVDKNGAVKGGSGGKDAPSSHDAARATAYSQVAKKSGTHALSNAELQHLVNRMNLEQNYSRIATNHSRSEKGKKFVSSTLSSIGKQQINILAGAILAKKLAPLVVKLAG